MNAISRHWEVAKAALADDRARVSARIQNIQPEFLPAALEIIERPVIADWPGYGLPVGRRSGARLGVGGVW
jgi:hypothetical protein